MVEQLVAYLCLAWVFPVGPLVGLWVGIQIGRHGWRRGLTVILTKIFGQVLSEGMEGPKA